eukprot:m.980369 g.980369  ORF g.980369 m.980369 type:complete len:903 (-) comp23965_c1_seq3:323-3031(-)
MIMLKAIVLTSALAGALASKWPLRAKHADDVPASFDCEMRKLAYKYGKQQIPRMGEFESLYYALDLNSDDCNVTMEANHGNDKHQIKATVESVPSDAIFVHPDGSNEATGTLRDPLRCIQLALDKASQNVGGGRTVVLRGGTHYVGKTILLGPQHSNIAVRAYPGEDPVMSGGTKISVDWKPYNVTPAVNQWVVKTGINAVFDMKNDGTTCHIYGLTDSAEECQAACVKDASCAIYTWHDTTVEPSYRKQCWFRLDGQWIPKPEGGHVSGYNAARLPQSTNIYVTNIKGQVDDVPGLLLNGVHATRARYPNIPGGLETSCGYGCMVPGGDASWTPPDFNKFGPVTYYQDNISSHVRNDTPDDWFQNYMIGINGLCSVYDPPVSYWCSEHTSGGGAFAFRTPSGVTPKSGALPHAPYADVSQAIFFVWRPARWANWMFEVGNYDVAKGNFTFGKGGNQGARGNNNGGDYFIENVFEELDFPGEFFYNASTGDLYLNYNGTGAPPASTEFVVPQKQVLVNASGTQWNPVTNVSYSGITFTATSYTYMNPHGVPSAGDWALDRYGAIFLQGTEGAVFDSCKFDRLDGNAVMVSGYNRNATVHECDFSYIGGNAVAAWGYTNETDTDPGRPGVAIENAPVAGVDGTDGEHPVFTTVTSCTAREVGLYEKQSSFFVQAKTAQSVIVGNVFFNGPRAGINANDGFGGGDEIAHNLVFSTCRESGDHGPFNSWDRQPFLTTVRTGKPDMIMQWRDIHHNFFIDNYSPQEDVDNDDGSAFYHTHHNFLVYGGRGMKNDFGGHDNHHYNNIYGYVGSGLGVCSQLDGHEDQFYNNKLVMTGTNVGSFTCTGTGKTVVYNNSYYTPDGTAKECGKSVQDWQKEGEDKGSTVASFPSDATIMGWAADLLGIAH